MKHNLTSYATLAATLRLCLFHWALGGRKRVTLFSFPSAKIIVKCEWYTCRTPDRPLACVFMRLECCPLPTNALSMRSFSGSRPLSFSALSLADNSNCTKARVHIRPGHAWVSSKIQKDKSLRIVSCLAWQFQAIHVTNSLCISLWQCQRWGVHLRSTQKDSNDAVSQAREPYLIAKFCSFIRCYLALYQGIINVHSPDQPCEFIQLLWADLCFA